MDTEPVFDHSPDKCAYDAIPLTRLETKLQFFTGRMLDWIQHRYPNYAAAMAMVVFAYAREIEYRRIYGGSE